MKPYLIEIISHMSHVNFRYTFLHSKRPDSTESVVLFKS